MGKPRVALIGTGGTISSIGRHALDLIEYPDTGIKLSADEVLEHWTIAREADTLVPIPYRAVGSMQIGPDDWLALCALITKTAEEEPDLAGFVITHGTASTEETAYFLNLVLTVPQAVVVVGAQRPPSGPGSSGGGAVPGLDSVDLWPSLATPHARASNRSELALAFCDARAACLDALDRADEAVELREKAAAIRVDPSSPGPVSIPGFSGA